jgi:hypothetical protein
MAIFWGFFKNKMKPEHLRGPKLGLCDHTLSNENKFVEVVEVR